MRRSGLGYGTMTGPALVQITRLPSLKVWDFAVPNLRIRAGAISF